MGFLKGGVVIVLGVLLFASLLALSSFLTMSISLNSETVKTELSPVIRGLADNVPNVVERFDRFNVSNFDVSGAVDEIFLAMETNCESYEDYVYIFEGQTIVVSCDLISEGRGAVVNKTTEDFIEGIYYKNYDCNFWNCFSKEKLPFFLVSQKSKDYWNSKYYFFLASSLILVGLLFFFVESRTNWIILTGVLMILSSFSFIKLYEFSLKIFSSGTFRIFSLFFDIFFIKANTVFWIIFIFGVFLSLVGIGIKIWFWDSIKRKFSRKDVIGFIREELGRKKTPRGGNVIKGKNVGKVEDFDMKKEGNKEKKVSRKNIF